MHELHVEDAANTDQRSLRDAGWLQIKVARAGKVEGRLYTPDLGYRCSDAQRIQFTFSWQATPTDSIFCYANTGASFSA